MTDNCCICYENRERMVLLKDYYKCECNTEICLDCLMNVKDIYDCLLCRQNLREGLRKKIRYSQEQINYVSDKITKEIEKKRKIQKNIDNKLWSLMKYKLMDLALKSVSILFVSYLVLITFEFKKILEGLAIIFAILFYMVYLKQLTPLFEQYNKIQKEINILENDQSDVNDAFVCLFEYEEQMREQKNVIKIIEKQLIDYENKTHSVFQKYLHA